MELLLIKQGDNYSVGYNKWFCPNDKKKYRKRFKQQRMERIRLVVWHLKDMIKASRLNSTKIGAIKQFINLLKTECDLVRDGSDQVLIDRGRLTLRNVWSRLLKEAQNKKEISQYLNK